MKRILAAVGFLLALSAPSFAQCTGIFADKTVCGNTSGASSFPRPVELSSILSNLALTQYHFFIGDASNIPVDTALEGDCTYTTSYGIICTKTNNVPFGPLATLTDPVSVSQGGTGVSSLTADLPLIGNGTSPVSQGTKSGNTNVFATTSGSSISGDCVEFDASGNLIAGGATCGRELITSDRTFYVRTPQTAITYTIASPCIVNWTSHSLTTNSAVVFTADTSVPTGVTAGQIYYVISTGLTSNSFQFSASMGGAAINCSGAGTGTQYAQTGSDSNDGSAATASSAFLTLQGAYDAIKAGYALGTATITVNVEQSIYGVSGTGGGQVFANGPIVGQRSVANFVWELAAGVQVHGSSTQGTFGVGSYAMFTVDSAAGSTSVSAVGTDTVCFSAGPGIISLQNTSSMTVGQCDGSSFYVGAGGGIYGSTISVQGDQNNMIFCSATGGVIEFLNGTITYVGTPTYSNANVYSYTGCLVGLQSQSFSGSAIGQRYLAQGNGLIYDTATIPGTVSGLSFSGGQRNDKTTYFQFQGQIKADTPTCDSSLDGTLTVITDAATVTWGATIGGGSTNVVLAFCNSANGDWTVAGK